jgi:hypothetical protein
MADLFDRYLVIDVDSHISEPADVWTSRVSSKWGAVVPHIERQRGKDIWFVGGEPVLPIGTTAIAGFDGTLPGASRGPPRCERPAEPPPRGPDGLSVRFPIS